MANFIDPRVVSSSLVRIINAKSGKYLSLDGPNEWWNNNDTSVTVRSLLNISFTESPQTWIIEPRDSSTYSIRNELSGKYLSIRARGQDNDNTVIQYENESLSFQHWTFIPLWDVGKWLIRNDNSGKYIGPQNRSIDENHYCIQFDDETQQDPYQEWIFEQL